MKRVFDFLIAVLGILILSIPIAVLAILVRVKLGNPIFFKQTRPGLKTKPFEMVKFRTMLTKYSLDGEMLPDAMRMTTFGEFMRSTSLDELPELWNVLKGDMSLVGPRPLLIEYLPLYSKEQSRRHEVKPGITGWAQINGRNAISWEEKFELDVWYVDNRSLRLDMVILFLTAKKVFMREGISPAGDVTMRVFNGRNENSNER